MKYKMDTEEYAYSERVKVAITLFYALCHGRATADKGGFNNSLGQND
jgi:hypothetical protein